MSKTAGRVRFGPFVIDADTRQLIRDAAVIHLTPKAYQLLTVLVEESPRAVSKDELQQRLWPSTFVDEANLSVLVAELRAALEDDARNPRYIRTVHGFGYAFAASVERQLSRQKPASAEAWWLVSDSEQFRLGVGESLVGRESTADVWLDSSSVSRRHARIVVGEDDVWLEDLGSKNGTWVNGERVTERTRLNDHDHVRLGSVKVQVRRAWTAGSTESFA